MSNITKKGFKVLSPFGNVTTGKIYFVDSTNTDAADGGTGASAPDWGTEPDKPFATVDYAIGQCTASKGDIIYVMPGHTETLATTGDLIPDVAGVSIIGLGRTASRPTFSISTTAAGVSAIGITGAGTLIQNVIFRMAAEAGSSGVGIYVGADDVQIDNCRFDHSTTACFYSNTVEIATGQDRPIISNNIFFNVGTTAQSDRCIDISGTGAHIGGEIVGNKFLGNWTTAVLRSSTDAMMYNWNISDNVISNNSTIATSLCVNFTSSQVLNGKSGGVMARNLFMSGSSLLAAAVVIAQCWMGARNSFSNSTIAFWNAKSIESS